MVENVFLDRCKYDPSSHQCSMQNKMSAQYNNLTIQSIQNILQGISQNHPCFSLQQFFMQQIQQFGQKLCLSTSYESGHFTGSAIILSPTYDRVLLIYHPFFETWIQPGGHIEELETIQDTIFREVYEETNISKQDLKPLMIQENILAYLQNFDVPQNILKQRPHHQHFDICLFLIHAKNNVDVSTQPDHPSKTLPCKWFSLSDIDTIPTDNATKTLLHFVCAYLN